MARFDWWQATVFGSEPQGVGDKLVGVFDLSDLAPGRGLNGYHHGAYVRRGVRVLAKMMWGGNPGVHVIGTGEEAPKVARALDGMECRVTRVDACEDWIQAGLYDRLAKGLISYAEGHGIKIDQQGDWVRGKERTLYLGSRKSACQLVLYEKGYEIGLELGGDPNHVRLEARVYPKGDAGYRVAEWYPNKVFAASRWMVGALERIGWGSLQLEGVGTVRRPEDDARARLILLRQYKAILRRWADEEGSWQGLGEAIERELDQLVQA